MKIIRSQIKTIYMCVCVCVRVWWLSGKELLWWLSGKESAFQCRRSWFNPWAGKFPQRRKWQPILVFLPEKSHGQRRLVGYSPWGHKELDMT